VQCGVRNVLPQRGVTDAALDRTRSLRAILFYFHTGVGAAKARSK
jgi:hypothetical protein